MKWGMIIVYGFIVFIWSIVNTEKYMSSFKVGTQWSWRKSCGWIGWASRKSAQRSFSFQWEWYLKSTQVKAKFAGVKHLTAVNLLCPLKTHKNTTQLIHSGILLKSRSAEPLRDLDLQQTICLWSSLFYFSLFKWLSLLLFPQVDLSPCKCFKMLPNLLNDLVLEKTGWALPSRHNDTLKTWQKYQEYIL